MQGACEAGAVLALLEGGAAGARGAAEQLRALYGVVREPWLTRALLAYHARTDSARALDLLARAPEPHARHLLDALLEQLRAPDARRAALAALAPLVARRPPWLHLLPAHPLARELLRAARTERDAAPLLHALLALAALVPAAPALAGAHAPELAEALVRAAAAEPPAALAAHALFRAVYATHPCTAVEALRGAGAELGPEAWERAAAALAAGLRLHPRLLAGSRAREADPARWARVEPHDVLAECRRLALPARAPAAAAPAPAPEPAPAPLPWRADSAPPPGSTAQATRAVGALQPGGEGWWSLGERLGAEAAPHTPLPADDGPEPEPEPEPAVEATPENTPRLAFRFPSEARAGAAAGPGAAAARLARLASERRAADSPVPIGGAPPAAAARPEPRRAAPEPEDREVRELTTPRAAPPPDWADAEPARPRAPDPRAAAPAPRRPAARAPPPRRPASAGPPAAARRADSAVQTVDAWPEPYEFLIADFYRAEPDVGADQAADAGEPTARLDAYLTELYAGRGAGGASRGELAERLELAHAHLMYERWRREAHAERNRRLLGRCRQVRALELRNDALLERVRELTRERDALRARAERRAAPAPAPAEPGGGGGAGEPARALEDALRAERAARLRAEAARHEAEAARARDLAELQRERGDAFEAARHVEALARAALQAERRADHVRRLRRELLVLAEREARLAAAARAGAGAAPAPPPADAALRAAAARADADAAAAGARADAAVARAAALDAALGARDAALAELRRGARQAAERDAARARSLADKYAALMAVVREQEARRLELRAAPAAHCG